MQFIILKKPLEQALKSIEKKERILVCGAMEEKESIEENIEYALETPQEIIAASENINISDWFETKRKEMEEEWGDLSDTEGIWTGEINNKQEFTLGTDILTGKKLNEVLGLEVKVEKSWHIPAHLKYGGWNDCPLTDIQCAIWKYWEDKFGAKIIGASHDVIEAYVANPPKNKDDAMKLAWEQYIYCYDIVDQGVETVANLAGILMNGNYWYFWWD